MQRSRLPRESIAIVNDLVNDEVREGQWGSGTARGYLRSWLQLT